MERCQLLTIIITQIISIFMAALDWGLTSYEDLPTWIGGDEGLTNALYVTGLQPGIQYRVVLYFELVSVTHHTE